MDWGGERELSVSWPVRCGVEVQGIGASGSAGWPPDACAQPRVGLTIMPMWFGLRCWVVGMRGRSSQGIDVDHLW